MILKKSSFNYYVLCSLYFIYFIYICIANDLNYSFVSIPVVGLFVHLWINSTNKVSPLSLFLLIFIVTYLILLPIHVLNSSLAYYMHDFYNPVIDISMNHLDLSFLLSSFALLTFIFGYSLPVPKMKIYNLEKTFKNYKKLSVLSSVFVVASFLFRFFSHVGMAGYSEATIPYAGYLYYPLFYISVILLTSTIFVFFKESAEQNKRLNLFWLLIPVSIYVITHILLGWKSAILIVTIILVLNYYIISKLYSNFLFYKKNIKFFIFLVVLITLPLFIIIPIYRGIMMDQNIEITFSLILHIINLFIDNFSLNTLLTVFFHILDRFGGITFFVPSVAFVENYQAPYISIVEILFDSESLNPENFLTTAILGVNPDIPTTNAPTIFGALLLHGGYIGLFIYIFIIGYVFKFIYTTLFFNKMYIFYSVFIVFIFLPVVMEGTLVNYTKKNLISLIVVYSFITLLVLIYSKGRKSK